MSPCCKNINGYADMWQSVDLRNYYLIYLKYTPRSDIRKLWEYNMFVKEYAHRASLRAALEGMRI